MFLTNEMGWKDWLLLLVPIIANILIMIFFNILIERKFKRLDKRDKIRDDVFIQYINLIEELLGMFVFSDSRIKTQEQYQKHIELMFEKIVQVTKFTRDHQYDLDFFNERVELLYNNYQKLVILLKETKQVDEQELLNNEHIVNTLMEELHNNSRDLMYLVETNIK